jgi:hypothetical protein
MSDYRESTLSGTSWTRARSLYLENPFNSAPSVLIREEEILNLGDRQISQPAGEINLTITDMTELVPLRNPETGELTGDSIAVGTVYQALYSFYWAKALERDAVVTPAE